MSGNFHFLAATIFVFALATGCTSPKNRDSMNGQYEFKQMSGSAAASMNETLASLSDQPGWPPMPRIWGDVTQEIYGEAELEIGLRATFFGAEASTTHNVGFNRGRKTTLIMITTKKEDNQSLIRSEDGTVYFNKVEGSKFVVLCQYTTFLTTSQRQLAKLSAFGNGISGEFGLKTVINRTNYSEFMAIDPVKTPNYYLTEVCDDIFRSEVEEAAEKDLKLLAYDVLTYSNPHDRCLPDETPDADGDDSCHEWHYQKFAGVYEHTTPRCEANSRGDYRCVSKAKKNRTCPLFKDSDGKEYGYPKNDTKLITSGNFEYQCDTAMGLKCKRTKAASIFEGIFTFAEAKCK